jgi:hypothetical protein
MNFCINKVERNFLMSLIEILTMVLKHNSNECTQKLVSNKFEGIFFRVLKINDSNSFDALFEMICPNYDPLFEPNLKLVDYLMDTSCISLSNYLATLRQENDEKNEKHDAAAEAPENQIAESEPVNEEREYGNMLFLTRLTSVVNKILKVGAKNNSILNKIIESKLVGAILKNSEIYIKSKYNKHLLIQIVQLQKSVLVSRLPNFQNELLESSIILQIFGLNKKRTNLLYSQILEFFKLMEESNGKDWHFPGKYILYFKDSLEKNRDERLISTLLKTQNQMQIGRRTLGEFGYPSRGDDFGIFYYWLKFLRPAYWRQISRHPPEFGHQ